MAASKSTYIHIDRCQHRMVYDVLAPHLTVAVYSSTTKSFVGIRMEHDRPFLHEEFHADMPAGHFHYGTVYPVTLLRMLPRDIDERSGWYVQSVDQWFDNQPLLYFFKQQQNYPVVQTANVLWRRATDKVL